MLLDELPPELLPYVYEYLTAREIWFSLRAVCRKLNHSIRRSSYWQRRVSHRCGLVLPERLKLNGNTEENKENGNEWRAGPNMNDRSTGQQVNGVHHNQMQWLHLMPIARCIATEHAAERWSYPEYGLNHFITKKDAHLGTIDTVRLFRVDSSKKLFCLSGSRDREIKLWDLETSMHDNSSQEAWECTKIDHAHDGWIWSISPGHDGSFFYSAGWDSMVRKWKLAEAEIRQSMQIQTSEAALCCISEGPNLLYVSTFHRGPILYDMRVGAGPVATQNCHGHKSVFQMATEPDSDQLFSIGDDSRLVAIDKRQFQRVVNTYKADSTIWNMDYAERQLCLSLRKDRLLFLNPDTFEIETLFLTNEESIFMGRQNIRLTRGAIYCASADSRLRIIAPGLHPRQIAMTDPIGSTVTRLDVLVGHMVAALGDGSLYYWPNKGTTTDTGGNGGNLLNGDYAAADRPGPSGTMQGF